MYLRGLQAAMMGKPNSEESDISQDSVLTSTQIAEPETQDIDSGQKIAMPQCYYLRVP